MNSFSSAPRVSRGIITALILLLAAFVVAAGISAAPASAKKKKKKAFCAKQIAMLHDTGHRYAPVKKSGGIIFYRDKKYKDDFITCSEKRKTLAEGENFDDDPAWTLKKFVGANDRCAIAVMEEATPHTYNSVQLGTTVIATFRLYTKNGTGFSYIASPGKATFDVPSIKFTKNCYAGWSEVRSPTQTTLEVFDIGNAVRYEDPNVSSFGFGTNGLADPNAWLLADNGKGATLSWSDASGANVKQIPAP